MTSTARSSRNKSRKISGSGVAQNLQDEGGNGGSHDYTRNGHLLHPAAFLIAAIFCFVCYRLLPSATVCCRLLCLFYVLRESAIFFFFSLQDEGSFLRAHGIRRRE